MSIQKKQRPPAVTLTDRAAERIEEMMEDAPEGSVGIMLGLKNAGCAGVSYVMDFTSEIPPMAEIVEVGDVKLVIEMKSLLFLLGTRIDFKTEKMRSGFTFRNPNQTDACGCGESVKLEEAKPKE